MSKGKYYFLLVSFLAIAEQIYLLVAVYFKGSKIALWMLSAWYIFGGIFAFGGINGDYFSIYTAMAIFYLGFIFFINLFSPISTFIEHQKLKA